MQNPFDPGYYRSDELRSFGFKGVGDNVAIARNCTIIGPENIEIGDNVRIDAFTAIVASSGFLRIGRNVRIHTSCTLGCRGGITMGDFSGLSHGVRLLTASDDFSGDWMVSNVEAEFTNPHVAPITIARHAIVCAQSVVLPGVVVGEGAIVGAVALVTHSLDPWGIYKGVPARRTVDRSRRLLALADDYLSRSRANAA
jgi:galactoside O-acetyltransferase